MDSIYVAASVFEISDNVMISPTNPTKDDEGIYIASQGGADLWIIGNLIVDNEFSAVRSGGTDAGKLYIVNNTFVRNGRTSLSAVRRDQATRTLTLRNNLYVSNQPSALQTDNNGAGFDIAYETIFGSPLCNGACPNAVIDMPTIDLPAGPGVENPGGSMPGDFTPMIGSTLVGTATPWLDRNGRTPQRFNGSGQERGAVELP